MSSVGRKLTLNFSKGRLKKKDHLQVDSDMGPRRGSWGTLHPRGSKSDKSGSMTNLSTADGDILNHNDILELTQIVRNFTDALYKLKDVFNLDEKPGSFPADEIKVDAHEKLGQLLCHLSGMKKFPAIFTSDVLMAVHHVITKVKLCNYDDVLTESGDILDCIDKLAMCFSTSVSEYLMGGMDLDSSIGRSKSCDNLARDDIIDGFSSADKQSSVPMQPSDIDQLLIKFDQAVDMALNRAKLWSKYAKDITYYVEKRANMEAEFAKNLAKLAHGVQQTISEDTFLPFQSIFCTALGQDMDYSQQCQATYQLIQTKKFVEPLTERRIEHDKTRKQLKDMWTKELKKMHDAVGNLKKARTMYVNRQQEYDKAKETAQKAESEGIAMQGGGSSQAVQNKIDKKKKLEEDCMHKAMEAETTYKNCVMMANTCQQDLERVKSDILSQTRDLLFVSDQIMKTATVGYFQLQQSAITPIPSQYKKLCEISDRYEPGFQYAEYVKALPAPERPYVPQHYTFEPFNPDIRGYDLRKPSTQSSGSGSDIQQYAEDSPLSRSRHQRQKSGGMDADSDSESASSSRSTSPSASPSIQKRARSEQTVAVSSEQLEERFRGVLLSPSARTHTFRKLRAPTRCRHCDSYVYFQGAECDKCGLASHKRCLETLTNECGTSPIKDQGALQRRMTTFGVDVCSQVTGSTDNVPPIVRKCTDEIDKRALDIKGIYRVSGVKSRVEGLCQYFESDSEHVDLSEHNPHVISNVLKLYLRQLPEPLLTFKLYPVLMQLARDESNGILSKEEMQKCVKDALHNLLPAPMLRTLAHLMHHLARVVKNESANQMTASNLGIVFGPTLLRSDSDGGSSLNTLIDTPHQTRLIEMLILQAENIFGPEEKDEQKEDSNLLRPDKGRSEGTTPVSGSSDVWPADEDITGNLLEELESDPKFMMASSTASKFKPEQMSAETVEESTTDDVSKTDSSQSTESKQQEPVSTFIKGKTVSGITNKRTSGKSHSYSKSNKQSSSETKLLKNKDGQLGDLSSSKESVSRDISSQEPVSRDTLNMGSNERQGKNGDLNVDYTRAKGTNGKDNEVVTKKIRKQNKGEGNASPSVQPGNTRSEHNHIDGLDQNTEQNMQFSEQTDKGLILDSHLTNKTLKAPPLINLIQSTFDSEINTAIAAQKPIQGSLKPGSKSIDQNEATLSVSKLDNNDVESDGDVIPEDVETALTVSVSHDAALSRMHEALISPPVKGARKKALETDETHSPGLKKKLLPSHVRKSHTKQAYSAQLLQPRPFSFRVHSPQAPHAGVSSRTKTYKTQDDLALPRSPKPLRMKSSDHLDEVTKDPLSKSATSSSSVLKQLHHLNRSRGKGEIRYPPYVSPFASPVISPNMSPKNSPDGSPGHTPAHTPGHTPKVSPMSSPLSIRRSNSPLTLVSDHEPQYV